MLATSMQEFMTSLVDWLPTALEHIAEIALYFGVLTVMMMIPLVLWLGYAMSSTRKRAAATPPAP
jgi:hypothetical protein